MHCPSFLSHVKSNVGCTPSIISSCFTLQCLTDLHVSSESFTPSFGFTCLVLHCTIFYIRMFNLVSTVLLACNQFVVISFCTCLKNFLGSYKFRSWISLRARVGGSPLRCKLLSVRWDSRTATSPRARFGSFCGRRISFLLRPRGQERHELAVS